MDAFTLVSKVGSLGSDMGWSEGGTSYFSFFVKFCRNLDSRNGGVVVVGLYYGFLTTFSIGPSYLFLLRARVIEEGIEKKVSATTGFIMGQLMMFISIYYAPLHLALSKT
ncbi:hypothetical protein SO802_015782 [Lithocarpus litseifolius]|uniref:Protein TIC 214 n=1 Tax=Lithocarpus litseifolius TaxID=425828 RepID=A0AAW2CZZ5_9ROSI